MGRTSAWSGWPGGLDADGTPTGGWGPWQTVPDWPFWENQGADCAVADVDGDGSLELVLLVVDNPGGQNAGLYRTAALGSDGTASGWSSWVSVPDWFPFENVGAGLAVGDLDGDGTPELLVLMVDSAVGKNDAFYSVGWRLDGRGRPADGWGPWQKVPGWDFHENQGGAITAADLDGDGLLDLVVLAVDNPVGQNAGLVRVVPWRRTWPPPRRRASGASSRWTPGCSPYTPRCCPRATSSSSPDRVTTRTPRPPSSTAPGCGTTRLPR